ncbi:MAG: hypothetical protein WA733_23220 [Methylocystis sp.]
MADRAFGAILGARTFAERGGFEMRKNLSRSMCGFAQAFLAAMLVAALSSEASADVRHYIRWKANGQLDYRLLLRRYMPVSSFRYGREWYGSPYSAYGGLLNPNYDPTYVVVPVYYYPRNSTRP